MEPAVEQLLHSPKLAIHVEALQRVLADERARRERFVEDLREDQKAEFINGEVVVHSPAKDHHSRTVTRLLTLLHAYVEFHELGKAYSEKALISLTRNDYEPDVCFFSTEKVESFTGTQMRYPAPDFICEVLSPSTEQMDRTIKMQDYAAHGVQEYWLLDPAEEMAEQYVLRGEAYALMTKARTGDLTAEAIPGFTLPVRALFDDRINLDTLRTLLMSAD